MKSPFKFLDAYSLKDKDVFFGRNKEVETLYDLLFRTPIVLVHGLSGTGKTSLIQCGLASRYEGPEWYPFFIRRQENINTALRIELQKALPGRAIDQDLPGFLQQVFETYYSPVYLIFDQFEELFILGTPDERQQFVSDLKAILDAELPCKIILVMREEFLGRLYGFEQKIPYLFDFRMRIEPMNMARVKDVISQSFAAFNISLEPPAEERIQEIIENVSGGKSGIELPYLQVYLDLLYQEDYQRSYPGEERLENLPPLQFTREEIAAFGKIGDVLEKFLLQQEQQLQEQLLKRHAQLPLQAVRNVLDVFVTEEGTKQPVRFQREKDSKQIIPEERVQALLSSLSLAVLSDCLEALEESRLLRFSDDEVIELAHDKLAALIHEQRTEEQRSLIRARTRLKFAMKERQLSGAFLNRKQLEDLEQYLDKLAAEPGIAAFVQANREHLEELETAEEQRRQRELTLAKEKLRTEQRARSRQRIFLFLVSVFLMLAVWQWWQARQSNQQALSNLALADEANEQALAYQEELKDALDTVNLAKQEALDNLELANQREAEAKDANATTKATLKKLQIASQQTVKLLLKESRQLIRNLKYEEAQDKLGTAANLNVLKDSIGLTMLEVAYFYQETERKKEARQIAQRAGKLLSVSLVNEDWPSFFEKVKPEQMQLLRERHYPVMQLVPAGQFSRPVTRYTVRSAKYPSSLNVAVDSFFMAKMETTIWQFALFCAAKGKKIEDYSYSPTLGLNGPNPVVKVDWYDALEYANWVSVQKGLEPVYLIDSLSSDTEQILDDGKEKWKIEVDSQANGLRLPTDAEWQYAARGGPHQGPYQYSGSDDLDEVGWYRNNSSIEGTRQTQAVAGKKPNSLGLYDMSGNVWEWCWDEYVNYDIYDRNTGIRPPKRRRNTRVLYGGSWSEDDILCKVFYRLPSSPRLRSNDYGFRLARGL